MNQKQTLDPRDPEQLARFLFDRLQAAGVSRGLFDIGNWDTIDDDYKATWRDLARDTHARFAPDSAADVPLGEGV